MTYKSKDGCSTNREAKPVFVVGCSRSGTTLVQSLLASGGELVAFPETNVLYFAVDDLNYRRFGNLIGHRRLPGMLAKRLLNRIGLTLNFSWDVSLNNLPHELRAHLSIGDDGRRWLIRSVLRDFHLMMESATGGARWLEKTPQNIFVLDFIEKYYPNAQFVHVLRDPVANIASLMDAAKKYPAFRSRFGGSNGLEKAIAYCKNARKISLSRHSSRKHFHVEYEKLTANLGLYLREMEFFLGLKKDTLRPVYDTQGITKPEEIWKQNREEVKTAESKENKLFSKQQIEEIRRQFAGEKEKIQAMQS
ncbi:sulfotransferase [Aquisalimonas lutea]|uniref:sulfotransferase n=1 Tax=Aquisalimonas lutea TaxID=1327750 RepID=UPI0025B46507|nr:sulfotransferase [Aquisalimonas lutea]MDN3517189.1 sulfotransferase [Aquisalimonas lutea]